MKTIIEEFARFFVGLHYEQLPEHIVIAAKKNILDIIGVSIGGVEMEFPQMLVNYLVSLEGRQEATLICKGGRIKVPAMNAAFGNSACGHALDMDGGHRFGGGHAGVTVIPAAIAGGESKNADGKKLILGVVLGIEIICRIGRAVDPSHLKRGFHRTSTIGPFGAAAAVGKIYGLSEKALTMAMGFAGLQGAGLLEVLNTGAMAKPLQPAKAAMAGVISAELAIRNAESPATILEGEKGFFKAMADEVNTEELIKNLGNDFYIADQYFKLHASCRHTHPAIDAVLNLKKLYQIDAGDLSEITISTYPVAVDFAGKPHNPKSIEEAKFSIPFSVSLAMIFGDVNMDRYCLENIRNEDIHQLSSLVQIKSDKKWENLYPFKRGATVAITKKDGRKLLTEVELAKGEPENPATIKDLLDKFYNNTARMKKDSSERLIEIIFELEKYQISDLAEHLLL
ncbi:MAG: MmgE/PrpD family protein [Syntrophaceae bacterium]|nr:MmgE/PrpD family protein [Syntrophaceae bacterium]